MIQRSILRSSRALSSRVQSQSAAASLRQSSPFLTRPSTLPPSISRTASRWYSDAAEAKQENTSNGAEAKTNGDAQPAANAAETEKLRTELEAKNQEVVDLKDKYLRSVADFRNLQERTKREIQSAKDFALSRFAKDLVESVDNLDRALLTVPREALTPENKDLVTLHDGLKMTETILMQTLKKHGLERFDPSVEKEKFDPNVHEAVFMAPQQGKEDGTVFFTQQKGFLLNGRVLRAAKVGVVKNE
ncbi:GrpE, mitochondrial [Coniosporium apollinis]|uniref:GrpE protein homolog n=1 Tax=Coniosporium apollinis TaxID=61459 RepID=A0ABQ9NUG2_9PEZI|nr:GrpE, mitochondrial [Coniosporium apollinis]